MASLLLGVAYVLVVAGGLFWGRKVLLRDKKRSPLSYKELALLHNNGVERENNA